MIKFLTVLSVMLNISMLAGCESLEFTSQTSPLVQISTFFLTFSRQPEMLANQLMKSFVKDGGSFDVISK
jgi:hypothetical protein